MVRHLLLPLLPVAIQEDVSLALLNSNHEEDIIVVVLVLFHLLVVDRHLLDDAKIHTMLLHWLLPHLRAFVTRLEILREGLVCIQTCAMKHRTFENV